MKTNNTSFKELLQFHRKLHDLDTVFEYNDTTTCYSRRPGKNKLIFDFPYDRLLICLPPKCASTSFHRAFTPFAKKAFQLQEEDGMRKWTCKYLLILTYVLKILKL